MNNYAHTYRCPSCGDTESLNVIVLATARLTQDDDNFETGIEGDHEFAGRMQCRACSFSGPDDWFVAHNQSPDDVVVNKTEGGCYKLTPADKRIEGEILVDLSELIGADLEGYLDIIAIELTNNDCLMNIHYQVSGAVDGSIKMMVSGYLGEAESWHEFLENFVEEQHLTTCAICGEKIVAKTAHAHNGGMVGAECCWDERLRATE